MTTEPHTNRSARKPSHLRRKMILGTTLATSALLGGYRGYVRRAYAACTGAGGTYTCSGALTTTQTLSGAPLSITTAPGFSITTAIDRAFKLIGTNGLTFTDNNHSTISTLEPVIQPNDAIYARNLGSGTLSITTTGTVDSKGTGINAANDGSDLTITAADVSGITAGIIADNRGSGALSITTTGNIRGTGFEGIHATGSGTDITVTTGAGTTVTGDGGWAVDGQNSGTGALTINVNGNLVAFGQSGSSAIYAKNFSGTDLTITAAAGSIIRGDGNSGYGGGVYANNQGAGILTITSNGEVNGTNGHGLFAKDYGTGLVVTVGSLGTVSGATDGILAHNYGAGALAITVSGAVTGGTAQGIYARNDSATASSISTVVIAGGGAVTGGSAGIQFSSTTGRDASLTNAGAITGGVGILADVGLGAATITNSGNITGSAGTAINFAGTTLANTINQQGGTISGDILLSAAADQVNVSGGTIAGNITGQGHAVVDFALGAGSFTLAAPYAITGTANVILDSGTITIAGSADSSTLTINGGTMTVTGAINAATFNLNGGLLSVGSGSNLGASLGVLAFNGGMLENSGPLASARSVAINSGGATLKTDADLTLSGVISGTGPLVKTGAGTLILTGANSFGGSTTISAGSLQLGNGGTSGSIAGNVVNNGALVFYRADAINFGGAISGTGSVTQNGSGRTVLSAANTFIGGTILNAGILSVSQDTNLGAPSGALTFNGGVLENSDTFATARNVTVNSGGGAFKNDANLTLSGVISGSGALTKTGAGSLIVTSTNSFAGATTITAGTLVVNGSLASSSVAVQSGASLGGNGTVGASSIQSGGNIAPGNSIGTLNVNGNFTQSAGSIYQVEVDPNTNASDLIAVNGTATLQNGAALNVIKIAPGDYKVGTVYKVLSTTSGLSGIYTLTGDTGTAALGLKDSYDANNAYLTVVQARSIISLAGDTGNQQAVAQAIESLPPTDPLPTAVLNLPDALTAQAAFDQLSASALVSAKGALVSNGLYVRDATLDRLRDVRCGTEENQNPRSAACDSERPSLWAQGFGGWGGVSGNANASGLNRSAAGMLAGFDLPVMDWRAGIFAGFSNSDFHQTSGPARGESTDYHLGAYGGTNWDGISVSLGASYTWNAIRTDRAVAFGSFTDRLQATYNAGVTQLFAEAGYGMEVMGLTLEPFANLAYLNLRTDGFREVGGAAALTGQADTIENVVSTFGIRPSTTLDLGNFPVTLRGMVGWRHTFGTVTPSSTVSFAGSDSFTASGAPIARDAMALEAGFDFAVADNISAGLTYGGQLSSRTTDQTARGTIRIAF